MLGPSLFAYVGLGAGLELIPYFLALLAWCATALGMALFWPATALYRRLRRLRPRPGAENAGQDASAATAQAAELAPSGNEPVRVGAPASPGDEDHVSS